MKLQILEFAALEIENGQEFYNLQQDKLGDSFKNDVRSAIDNIVASPKLYPEIDNNLRRCVLHRFPYTIFYAIDNDTIVILSVAHQRRKPYYWVEKESL
jgi:plasmid stabilization system protein ParE